MTIVLALIFVPQTRAALLVYESFTYTSGSNVDGQNGGTGFSGAWFDPVTVAQPTVSTGLTYPGLPTAGNAALLTPAGGNPATLHRSLSGTYNSGTVYISVLASKNDGSRYFGLKLNNNTNENGFIGQGGLAENWQYFSPANGGSRYSSTVSSRNSGTNMLVLKIEFGAGTGGNDKISLFMNPTTNIEPSPSVTSTDIKVGTFNTIGITAGYMSGGQTTSTGTLDEIRIGTTFADVVPIPEPTTTAAAVLASVALMTFAIRRRRRLLKTEGR